MERSYMPKEVCELTLAHVYSDREEAACRRSDLLDCGRWLMEQRADFIAG